MPRQYPSFSVCLLAVPMISHGDLHRIHILLPGLNFKALVWLRKFSDLCEMSWLQVVARFQHGKGALGLNRFPINTATIARDSKTV